MKLLILLVTAMFFLAGCELQEKDTETKTVTKYLTEGRSLESNAITNEFGALKVVEGDSYYIADFKPWSSWWYPLRDREMFYNPNGMSPLEKYDRYVYREFNIDASATEYEEEELYNETTAVWAGLCHAWAVASVLHPEPNSTSVLNKVEFTPGDKKALLIKSYENVKKLKIYGDRYDGNSDDNYDDVYPDQFHRFVQYSLGEQKKPFLMDYDPSYPVWTVPVYEAKFRVKRDTNNSVNVTAWVTIASPFVDSTEYIGTKKVTKIYEYTLKGRWDNEEFIVSDGDWGEDSAYDHPDYLIKYPSDAERSSFNKEINNEFIDSIVKSQRRNKRSKAVRK